MKKPELFKEYIWLVNIIKHYRKISLQEINTLWLDTEMSEGIPFARSTFNRHKDAIEDMFGIIIDCDRRDGYRYYIANEEVLGQHTVQNWMLSTLTVSNVIAAGMSLRGRILLESIPVQGKKLAVAIHAMRAGCCLMIDYRKYGSKQSRQFVVEPYCLKYFRQRWYILARYKKNGYYAMLSLDRIEDMLVSDVRFKLDPDFDAEEFFSAYYGVFVDDEVEITTVTLRAHGLEAYYLRDLPLHDSQRLVAHGDGWADYKLQLRPTADFIAKVVSRGSWLEVLSPQWVIDKVVAAQREAIERYEQKK